MGVNCESLMETYKRNNGFTTILTFELETVGAVVTNERNSDIGLLYSRFSPE